MGILIVMYHIIPVGNEEYIIIFLLQLHYNET